MRFLQQWERNLPMPAQITRQFSVFLVNKPGVLAQVTKALAGAKVNIVAMTLVDSQEHGVMRLVVASPAGARDVLRRLNLPITETDVMCLELSNNPGALADVAGLLGRNHININYAYVSSGAPGGRTTGIFKVNDVKKAQQLFKDSGAKHKEPNLRRAPARR
jgi:hypothetical protein